MTKTPEQMADKIYGWWMEDLSDDRTVPEMIAEGVRAGVKAERKAAAKAPIYVHIVISEARDDEILGVFQNIADAVEAAENSTQDDYGASRDQWQDYYRIADWSVIK